MKSRLMKFCPIEEMLEALEELRAEKEESIEEEYVNRLLAGTDDDAPARMFSL